MDLAGVGGADRGQTIGGCQPRLQEIHPAVELEWAEIEKGRIEVECRETAAGEQALIGQVVGGEDGFRPGQSLVSLRLELEESGCGCSLPVVQMNDVAVVYSRHLQDGSRKKCETLGIVRIVAVQMLPVEELVRPDKIDIEGLGQMLFVEEARHQSIGDGGLNDPRGSLVADDIPENRAVGWHHHGDLDSGGSQGAGERAHHIGEAAGLGERHDLRGGHSDIEF